jgi:hypothetical protein
MIQIAKKDIKVFKGFNGTAEDARSPVMLHGYGKLVHDRVLASKFFSVNDGICRHGIHASGSIHDALIVSAFVWVAVIPKGTKYYKSTALEASQRYNEQAETPVYRAAKLRLVRPARSRK